jgi:hypothetical protein
VIKPQYERKREREKERKKRMGVFISYEKVLCVMRMGLNDR